MRIHEHNKAYTEGVSEDGWMSMNIIYPILVDKFGYFKLIVFDPISGACLYDTKSKCGGLLRTKDESTCVLLALSCKKKFLDETLLCAFSRNHYYTKQAKTN